MAQLSAYKPPKFDLTNFKVFATNPSLPREEYGFDIYRKLILAKQASEALFIIQGKLLKEIRDEKLFEVLDYPNFTQFINSEEISFSREKAYMYIRIYEYFIEWLELDENKIAQMSVARLSMMLPTLKKIDNKEKAIEKMEEFNSMRHNDFVKDIKRIRTGGRPNVYWSDELDRWVIQFHPNISKLITLRDYEEVDEEETDNQTGN